MVFLPVRDRIDAVAVAAGLPEMAEGDVVLGHVPSAVGKDPVGDLLGGFTIAVHERFVESDVVDHVGIEDEHILLPVDKVDEEVEGMLFLHIVVPGDLPVGLHNDF